MTNNDIFKKLRVALQLRDDQIVEILQLVDFRISKGEIGNFFRSEEHPKYIACQDQILRNFLNGLVIYLRGTKEQPKNPMEVLKSNKEQIVQNNKTFIKKENHQKNFKAEKTIQNNPTQKTTKKFSAKPNILGNVKFNNGRKNKKTEN